MTDDPDFTQPHGAPGQKVRVLEWLREGKSLTQLEALQHLAVARLAAIIHRLREDDGHRITVEIVAMPTRYGDAKVARYTLDEATPPPAAPSWRRPCPIKIGEPEPRDPEPVQGPCECERPCETRRRVDTDAMRRELFPD